MSDTPHLSAPLPIEQTVRERYSAASQAAEPALCCPVQYDQDLLRVLPEELIERDYGCGDPSRFVQPGDAVLDLGSGGGKICYIASQIAGPQGRVVGADMNDEMLALARRHQAEISQRIGWDNCRFVKARIQDLALDLEKFEAHLAEQPVRSLDDWSRAEQFAQSLRGQPLIEDASLDVVLSNCVLNLVDPSARGQLMSEVFRVLKPGGRAVISDIVCSQPVPAHLRRDPELWSGCISGAFPEAELPRAFAQAGFYGVEILERQAEPWRVIEDIEFRSLTVRAFKPAASDESARGGQVAYRGPWSAVIDDLGRTFGRGEFLAVDPSAEASLKRPPFRDQMLTRSPSTPDGARPDSGSALPLAGDGNACGPGCC